MSEYIIELSDSRADEFIARIGIEDCRIYGCQLIGEIVRCRDCRHMHTVRSWLGNDVDECWLHADRESGALGKERTEPDGFCAWGERRGDAECSS